MAFFLYKARDKDGRLVEGQIDAELLSEAVTKIQKSGLFVVEIIRQNPKKRLIKERLESLWKNKVKVKDLALFCRQLSFMLETGLPLEYALQVNMHNQSSPAMKKLSKGLIKELRAGRSFGE